MERSTSIPGQISPTSTGGTVAFSGTSVTNVNTPVTIPANVDAFITGGDVNNVQNLTIASDLTWNGGSQLNGTGAGFTTQGTTTLIQDVTLSGADWTNEGTVDWLNGSPTLNNATFTNASGAAFDINTGGNSLTFGGTAAAFDNLGTVTKNGTGDTQIDAEYTNNSTGVLNALDGTLTFGGTFTQVAGGDTAAVGGTLVTGSSLDFNGGQFTMDENTTITGDVNSVGTIIFGNGDGTPGAVTIDGDFTLDPTSIVNFDIGGATPGTEHTQYNVTGTANIDGTAQVNVVGGFTPNGETFDIITCGVTCNGDFTALVQPGGFSTLNIGNVLRLIHSTGVIFWDNESGDGLWTTLLNWSKRCTADRRGYRRGRPGWWYDSDFG